MEQSRALLYVSNWSDFELRNGQCRDGTVDGAGTLLNGPPSYVQITLPPAIGKGMLEDGHYGTRAGRKGARRIDEDFLVRLR